MTPKWLVGTSRYYNKLLRKALQWPVHLPWLSPASEQSRDAARCAKGSLQRTEVPSPVLSCQRTGWRNRLRWSQYSHMHGKKESRRRSLVLPSSTLHFERFKWHCSALLHNYRIVSYTWRKWNCGVIWCMSSWSLLFRSSY